MVTGKTPELLIKIVTVATFTLLNAGTSIAAEKWHIVTWGDDAVEISAFDAFCIQKGVVSGDVLEINGYLSGEFPSKGEELLVPDSKSDLLATWMEVQNTKGGTTKPLVTIKLHGVPPEQTQDTPLITVKLHGVQSSEPEQSRPSAKAPPTTTSTITATKIPAPEVEPSRAPARQPDTKVQTESEKSLKNIRIVVSGDEIVLSTHEKPETALLHTVPVPAVISRDIVIPQPPALKPQIMMPSVEIPEKMMWPVSGNVSSGFGRRGKRSLHTGIDIPMPSGTPIVAALDGVVLVTATSKDRKYRGYGNTVLIDHGNGLVTWYAHCSKINVQKGQRVQQGEVVAFVGNTGRATTHHVHFEVRKNGVAENPIPHLASL